MADRQALFKAAKAQRASAAPTKEQLKALRAQKAQAAAEAESAARQEAESRQRNEAARSKATDQASRLPPRPGTSTMGPPASRPAAARPATASVGSAPGIVLRRTDSQRTRVGRNASIAPEPAGQSNASSGAVPGAAIEVAPQQSEERSIGSLPANFFDQPQLSGDQQASGDTGERIGSNAEVQSEVASALARGSSVEAISARTGLPLDFFEAAGSTEEGHQMKPEAATNSVRQEDTGPKAVLPKGFFANKDAEARAQGQEPPRRKSKEEEYKDFMSAIANDVKEADAAEEADAVQAAEDKEARERHEQKVRRDRIAKLSNGNRNLPDARAVLYSEADAPNIDIDYLAHPSRKRVRANGAHRAKEEESSDEDDPEADLNWRSKTL